jgi:flavorubredoxin
LITNQESRTSIDEIEDGIYRISTPIPPAVAPGGFSYNQYLVLDDSPLLFHTGPRRMFPLVSQAISAVVPIARLRYLGLSHVESDECGALNDLLAAAPGAVPVCSRVAALVSMQDLADRPPLALGDGETLSTGRHELAWIDAPHMPHAWECGLLFDRTTRTLFCGDLFTQGGAEHPPLTESDILGESEAFRHQLDYFSQTRNTRVLIEHIAACTPRTLACMHGSAWRGDGAALLRALGEALDRPTSFAAGRC